MTVAELVDKLMGLPPDADVTVYEDRTGDYEPVRRVRSVLNNNEVQILNWSKG